SVRNVTAVIVFDTDAQANAVFGVTGRPSSMFATPATAVQASLPFLTMPTESPVTPSRASSEATSNGQDDGTAAVTASWLTTRGFGDDAAHEAQRTPTTSARVRERAFTSRLYHRVEVGTPFYGAAARARITDRRSVGAFASLQPRGGPRCQQPTWRS